MTRARKVGFTLIELLIVIAIIAILALIAIPNFIEAQTRGKVSRSMADIRSQSVALESYYVDWNTYTRDSDSSLDYMEFKDAAYNMGHADWGQVANGAMQLTTPVAYMTSLLQDPFSNAVAVDGAGAKGYRIASGTWSYSTTFVSTKAPKDHQNSDKVMAAKGARACYAIIGVGPDGNRARIGYKCFPFHGKTDGDPGTAGPTDAIVKNGQPGCWTDYDPTNGTMSIGDIYRFGGEYKSGHFMLNGGEVGGISGATHADVW